MYMYIYIDMSNPSYWKWEREANSSDTLPIRMLTYADVC